ncbi:hypothetical protein LUZ60_003338 [Juncus effusus]|nr:hypothetical protein LUZ60_003338 [Juncus effusus]
MGDNRPYDYVCAICDNGGTILSCKGKCLRSFHPIPDCELDCQSLGFTKETLKEIDSYLCSNCRHKQHQCFACGQLGSSDKSNREVYQCNVSDCGHHYHAKCVSYLIHPNNEIKSSLLAKDIKTGSSFTCPRHKCVICKGEESRKISGLQFALCRRCPVAYHRRCLPREILFEDRGSYLTRAWDDLLPDRVLIYCMKHRIDPILKTPKRNHLKFPQINTQQKIVVKSKFLSDLDKQPDKKRARISEKISLERENNILQREKQNGSDNYLDKGKHKVMDNNSDKGKPKVFENNSYRDKQKYPENNNFHKEKQISLGDNLYREKQKVSESEIAREANLYTSSFPEIDKDTENKIRDLWEKSLSSVTIESIRERFKMPLTHRGMTKHIDQSTTEDEIKANAKMIKDAFARVQNGELPDQVKKDCSEEVVLKVAKWKNKMNVYLAPFIHMNRYTSFGRHFTKVDKLVKIVERLQWYVQDGDMVVDFCCGSNDFSILMRDKLESVGKKCFFKNFDLQEPKNDFNFERRDWMTVQPDELPDGSRLIMGLNPPFGMKAGLANKFIDQALKFRPKIIILIVPKETQRLDEKAEYDLTWQDAYLLSGKSFYLPGSIDDEHNRMDQWNLNPPPLYLWSRKDWAPLHTEIADRHGHLSQVEEEEELEGQQLTLLNPNSSLMESEQALNPNSVPMESEQIMNPNSSPKESEEILKTNFNPKESEKSPKPNSNPKESDKCLNPHSKESKPKESSSSFLETEEESESESKEEDEEESESEEEENDYYDDDGQEGVKEKEEAPPAGSMIEEGEITDLPLAGEISKTVNNNNNDDEQDVSGELIFLADMDISSPEYGEFQSACTKGFETGSNYQNINKGFETGGSSKIQFDYGRFGSDSSDSPEHDDPLTLGWWSDEEDDDDE